MKKLTKNEYLTKQVFNGKLFNTKTSSYVTIKPSDKAWLYGATTNMDVGIPFSMFCEGDKNRLHLVSNGRDFYWTDRSGKCYLLDSYGRLEAIWDNDSSFHIRTIKKEELVGVNRGLENQLIVDARAINTIFEFHMKD